MQKSAITTWLVSSGFSGENRAYIEQLYDDYRLNPSSVDISWQNQFAALSAPRLAQSTLSVHTPVAQAKGSRPSASQYRLTSQLLLLREAYRLSGHLVADLDPLQLSARITPAILSPNYYGITPSQLGETVTLTLVNGESKTASVADFITDFKRIYCGHIATEYRHMNNLDEVTWLQQRLECDDFPDGLSKSDKHQLLKQLTAAEGLERYIGSKFPGAKRFSLEGGDALVPMLNDLIYQSAQQGTQDVMMGMAHRGRLNTLVNVVGKETKGLFEQFAGQSPDEKERGKIKGSGDVKYHQGISADILCGDKSVHVSLAYNPSHLEIVSPVVMGAARARGESRSYVNKNGVLPITIHGDSAVVGQGVVQETLNMSQVRGYGVGGSLRIVVNNQIGFTTSKREDVRSSEYCSDIAKMIEAPIFHVNGDDIEAVIAVSRLALDYRQTFNKDVMIDLVCYRRHGHNEADEPNATQPLMYQKIKLHPTPRQLYATKLVNENIVTASQVEQMIEVYRQALDAGGRVTENLLPKAASSWSIYHNKACSDPEPETKAALLELLNAVTDLPKNLSLQSRIAKIYADRRLMAKENKALDWGAAETLAYATLVNKGIAVRLSGEDAGRGTFFHRHAVIHDQNTAECYVPLAHVSHKQAKFDVYDSVLSEAGVLAFEHGYASTLPTTLTIWEAQFGDFANGAQVVIDQFISASEQKWQRLSGLTLLLPHGYEGQGPEHSSARIERYLQLCAEENMQVCVPSTPSQMYHLLRRQVLTSRRRPLVVITPKSLLRHPLATSSIIELAKGGFEPLLSEVDDLSATKVTRLILCSGKVYYDVLQRRRELELAHVAIVRVEQLYPLQQAHFAIQFARYPQLREIIWLQEEPRNQGAWLYIQDAISDWLPAKCALTYVGRPASASPAVGDAHTHQAQQNTLINEALNIAQNEKDKV